MNKETGEATFKVYYWGGDQLGQVDYYLLNNFVLKSSPAAKKDKETGEVTVDFKNSGKIWKCPTLRRDLERLKSGRLGIIYSPHPSSKWSHFNYRQRDSLKGTEAAEKATDIKYANLKVPASYDQVPMIAELCKKDRSGEGDKINPPHNGNYAVGFLDGHVESYNGKNGYLHWCVGCDEHGDVKYTQTPDRGVKQ